MRLDGEEYVEVRIIDWTTEKVEKQGGAAHMRRSSESLANVSLCPTCAINVIGAMYGKLERSKR